MADDIVTLDPFKELIDFNFAIRLYVNVEFTANIFGINASGELSVTIDDATLDFEETAFVPEVPGQSGSTFSIAREYLLRFLPTSVVSPPKPGSALATEGVGSSIIAEDRFQVAINTTLGAEKGYMLDDIVRTVIDLGEGRRAYRIDFNIKYFDNS